MITIEQLEEFGMKRPEDQSDAIIYPMEKVIAKDDNGDEMAFAITTMYNGHNMILALPGGGFVNLDGVETIEELEVIEKCVTGYDPDH